MLKGPTVMKRMDTSQKSKRRCIFSISLLLVLLLTLVFAVNAQASFADAGSYTIKWYGADPQINNAPYLPTYQKIPPNAINYSGIGGRASDPLENAVLFSPLSPNARDAVTSLMPRDLALGQIVPFEVEITVSGSTAPESGTITFEPYWSTITTPGDNFGFDPGYKVIAAFVDTGDFGTSEVSPGALAMVSFTSTENTTKKQIDGKITVTGLDDGDKIVVEVWVVLKNSIPEGTGGNVPTGLTQAYTGTTYSKAGVISTGNQTVPLLQSSDFLTNDADISITKSDSPDPINLEGTLTYSTFAHQ